MKVCVGRVDLYLKAIMRTDYKIHTWEETGSIADIKRFNQVYQLNMTII